MHYEFCGGARGDVFHRLYTRFHYPSGNPPPSGVDEADGGSAGMAEVDGHAVGHCDRETKSPLARYVPIEPVEKPAACFGTVYFDRRPVALPADDDRPGSNMSLEQPPRTGEAAALPWETVIDPTGRTRQPGVDAMHPPVLQDA